MRLDTRLAIVLSSALVAALAKRLPPQGAAS
jgi:hypothetical protein